MQLLIQREALARLHAEDPNYRPMLCYWHQQLQEAERQKLHAHEEMVKSYIRTAPRPEKRLAVH